jgi:hypothetical protein
LIDVFAVSTYVYGPKPPFTKSALSHVAQSGSLRALECIWAASRAGFDDNMICAAIVDAFQFGHLDVAQALLSKIDPANVKSSIYGILLHGARRGSTEIAEILMPYMAELNDIRPIILAAAEAGNLELAKRLIGWQRERNPESNLNEILLAGIRVGDLQIARLIGVKPDMIRQMVEVSIQAGFLEGVSYALELLPEPEKAEVIERYAALATKSLTPAIRLLFAGEKDVGDGGDDDEDDHGDEGYDDYDYGC